MTISNIFAPALSDSLRDISEINRVVLSFLLFITVLFVIYPRIYWKQNFTDFIGIIPEILL